MLATPWRSRAPSYNRVRRERRRRAEFSAPDRFRLRPWEQPRWRAENCRRSTDMSLANLAIAYFADLLFFFFEAAANIFRFSDGAQIVILLRRQLRRLLFEVALKAAIIALSCSTPTSPISGRSARRRLARVLQWASCRRSYFSSLRHCWLRRMRSGGRERVGISALAG